MPRTPPRTTHSPHPPKNAITRAEYTALVASNPAWLRFARNSAFIEHELARGIDLLTDMRNLGPYWAGLSWHIRDEHERTRIESESKFATMSAKEKMKLKAHAMKREAKVIKATAEGKRVRAEGLIKEAEGMERRAEALREKAEEMMILVDIVEVEEKLGPLEEGKREGDGSR